MTRLEMAELKSFCRDCIFEAMAAMTMPEEMTVDQVAKMVSQKADTIRRKVRKGIIPSKMVGTRIVITREAAQRYKDTITQ